MRRKQQQKKKKVHVCCSCGTTENVEYGPDPYAADVHGDYRKVWECKDCRHESAMAI